MDFTDTDQSIFNELYVNPFQSAHAISQKLGLGSQKVRDRIHRMKSTGLLRPDIQIDDPLLGKRVQTEVLASYYPKSIGLSRQYVFFDNIRSKIQLGKLTAFCDEHPYTHYRAVAYGNNSSLYVQFDVPENITSDMIKLYRELASELDLGVDTLNASIETIDILPNFNKWSLFTDEWNFDKTFEHGPVIDSLWDEFSVHPENFVPEYYITPPSERYTMSELESKLLRELTVNAKIGLEELSSTYGRTKSVLSRNISKLKEHVIYRGMLLFREEYFGMNSFSLISGKIANSSKVTSDGLLNFFENNPLPLSGSIVIDEDRFLMEIKASPIISSEVVNFMWENTVGAEFKSRQIYIPKTFLYYFYPENYLGKGNWKMDQDYIRNIPLSVI